MTKPRLLFYIQHLLGIGHLVRGARIAAAAAEEVFDVTVVLGGERPAGIGFGNADIIELPPLKAGPTGFSALVDADGRPLDDTLRAVRREALLGLFARIAPDVLLIEAYPFGRRAMRFELLPVLEAARDRRPRPLVASSIRDILQESRRPEREAETIDVVRRLFDRVLVHGDPRFVRLEQSFPRASEIVDRLDYTGLVGPADGEAPASEEDFAVIVSVGGGAVGADLIATALAARPLSRLADAPWLILTGPNLPKSPALVAPAGVAVRPFVVDLPQRLRRARLSISQAGYNTVADLLGAPHCRAVLVPYVGDGETEQTRRAALMEARGFGVMAAAAALTPASLSAAIGRALDLPPAAIALDRGGAKRSAALLALAWQAHSQRLA